MPNTYSQITPSQCGFFQPAEWALHDACWLAWPSHGDLWQEELRAAQEEFTNLCRAIADSDGSSGKEGAEALEVLVPDEANLRMAERALKGLPVRFHLIPFGDIWLRDTAPIFLRNREGELSCVSFGFNGWGGKYILPHDDQVSANIARTAGCRTFRSSMILEGGSVEVDGEGTCLTTRQCLLNSNRNPGMNRSDIESELRATLGVSKVLWLGDGLLNDHTDGHIDTIARFVAPATVACMKAAEPAKDPNHEVYEKIAQDLSEMKDAKGRGLKVIRIPSPGRVTDEDGRVMPASFVNFYIGNSAVVVPTYGTPYDSEAVELIAELFPGRRVVGSSARAILAGGGAFHCISQQQPGGSSR